MMTYHVVFLSFEDLTKYFFFNYFVFEMRERLLSYPFNKSEAIKLRYLF